MNSSMNLASDTTELIVALDRSFCLDANCVRRSWYLECRMRRKSITCKMRGIATEDWESTLTWPSNQARNSCSPSLSPWVVLKRARRVVKVLEIEEGRKLSLSNQSILKPLP